MYYALPFFFLERVISEGFIGFRACKGSFMLYVMCAYEYRQSLRPHFMFFHPYFCAFPESLRICGQLFKWHKNKKFKKNGRDFWGEVNSWWDVLNICMILLPPGTETNSSYRTGRRLDRGKDKVEAYVRPLSGVAVPSNGCFHLTSIPTWRTHGQESGQCVGSDGYIIWHRRIFIKRVHKLDLATIEI